MSIEFGSLSDLPSEETSSIGTPSIQYGTLEDLGYSTNPLNGKAEPEEPVASWAKDFPTVYGVAKASEAVGEAVLHMVPYGKYALPSARDEFMKMSQEEQTKALLWDAAEAVAFAWMPRAGKDLKFLGKKLLSPFRKKPQVFGAGEALAKLGEVAPEFKATPFLYKEEMKKTLQGLGMGGDEAWGVTKALQSGSEEELIDVVLGRKYKGLKTTKTFDEATEWIKGGRYPKKRLADGFRNRFAEPLVRAKFYSKQFEKAVKKELLQIKGKKPLPPLLTQTLFKAQAERLYPELAKTMSFGTVGEAEMRNIVLDMLSHKATSRGVLGAGMGRIMPMSWMPARTAFGTGNAAFGTYDNIYVPVKGYFGAANEVHFNYIRKWSRMGEKAKLWRVSEKPTGFKLKDVKLTREEQELAYDVLKRSDELTMQIGRSKGELKGELKKAFVENEARLRSGSRSWALAHMWRSYSDELYGDFIKEQIPRIFRKAGISAEGSDAVQVMMAKLEPKIERLFKAENGLNITEKFTGIKNILEESKQVLNVEGYFPAGTKLEEVSKALTTKDKGGSFLPYLENYAARFAEHGDSLANSWRNALLENVSAGFTKSRKLDVFTKGPVDFSTMIEARTMAQAKELYLYDGLDEVVKFAKELPPAWADYTEHFLSRALNRPSITDHKTAAFLEKSVGSIARLFGREGLWDESRVMRLAQNVNNITYMGALGFKPFSVIRNLFQPLLLVPADLGGMRDLGTLAKGAWRAFRPETRAFIREIGAITDYAPEITMRPHALPFGKKKIFGLSQQKIDAVRDTSMWMFRGSDRWNRYVTGGAAMTKWEGALAKAGGNLETKQAMKVFEKRLNIASRNPWKEVEIKDLLRRGRVDEAKANYIKDVIADTQYLYGALDAPVVTGRSAIGRTGFIFQTWWMNYATTLEKWMRTGTSGVAKADRIFTAMTSAAIAHELMEPMWGSRRATKAIGLGPLPKEVSEFTIPPAWTPIYHGLSAILNMQDPDVSARHWKRILGTLPVMIPGGLQMKSSLKGAKEEGFEGFLKSVIGFQGRDRE